MKGCLADGYPFVFGFTVYESFESEAVAKSGKLNMPAKNEQVVGGHAVMAVGYDDKTKRFLIRNSWGAGWGISGYFTMPYDYLLNENLSDDFWTIRVIEQNAARKRAAKKTAHKKK
jgi:C1A family cysteine protease